MDSSVDYYAILGVLPHAEEVVIRAAYKALAQRYHPDRFSGTKEEATRRMQAINDAYRVLSDAGLRAEYDAARGTTEKDSDPYFGESNNDVPPSNDPLENDWAIAVSYYPDLTALEQRLAKIAWRLAYSYRAHLISEKAFASRWGIAEAMEQEFLTTYFGGNPTILLFAKKIIQEGRKDAARALNEAVRGCAEFCVNGLMAGNCRIVRRHDEHEEACSP